MKLLQKIKKSLLKIKPKTFRLTVIPTMPKIYFENIIGDLHDNAPTSEVVNSVKKCFINKYSAVFVDNIPDFTSKHGNFHQI